MHVAVIGAGAAGLCAAKHLTAPDSGFTCVVFEQTDTLGGTWVYTEHTGNDKYGLPIGSVMYKSLRTNLPTDNMEFPGFTFVNPTSFAMHNEVLQYLLDFADNYNLKKHIKFLHHVKQIVPNDNKWKITASNLVENSEVVQEFDAVVVCNGHHSTPFMGDIPGISEFEGQLMHSHIYKTPELFANKTVLVCGGGPSGIDITYDIAKYASKIYFTHRSSIKDSAYPENVQRVPQVKAVKKNCVEFENGSLSEHLDMILLCTGYKYTLPFLAPECGITVVNDKFVQPLYKDIVNIHHPTMGFIGISFHTFLFPLFDYQVRFYLKTLKGEVNLPSKEQMLAELEKKILENREKNVPVRKYHELGARMRPYLEELADAAQIEYLPPVVFNIYEETKRLREFSVARYKNVNFQRLDDNNFTRTDLK